MYIYIFLCVSYFIVHAAGFFFSQILVHFVWHNQTEYYLQFSMKFFSCAVHTPPFLYYIQVGRCDLMYFDNIIKQK